jgi:flavin reductase (DIM6/NTAB) family NADH-FMN oxidoreductase RutF
MTSDQPEPLARALGSIPSGLFIVTLRQADRTNAFLASWVMQAGFEPPMVTVAIARERPAAELLGDGLKFAVNILPEDDLGLIKPFAKGITPGRDPYEGIAVTLGTTGIETLDEALGTLECRYVKHMEAGDHLILLGEVLAGRFNDPARRPAIQIRKDGFRY